MGQSMAVSAYQEIKQAIMYGKIEPDEFLSEASLSKKLGHSRTSIRSALKQLEQEKLVVYKKNRGVTLRKASAKEMVDIMQICVEWMILATKQASTGLSRMDVAEIQKRLDTAKKYRLALDYVHYINLMPQVYIKIMEAAGNELLGPTYENLWARVISTSLYRKMSNPQNSPKKTVNTIQFFQDYLDFVQDTQFDVAIKKLEAYQRYTNHQILHYGRL